MKYNDKKDFDKVNMFGQGIENTMFAKYFIGDSFLNFIVKPGTTPLFLANVTFEPRCRNNWHIHKATKGGGQMLICTAGEGWYQEEGKDPISLSEGSFVYIPSNVKHWHGAKADSWFSHISLEIPGENTTNEWLEPVTDEVYNKLSSIITKENTLTGDTGKKYATKEEFEKVNIFGQGIENTMFAKYFIGNSYLNLIVKPGSTPLFLANVTFEPKCRNNWHVHNATNGGGQMLICTAGEGWYQEEGKEPVSLKAGSFIYIPTGVKHWHGAKTDSWFSHISLEVPGENTNNEWLEPVTDEVYNAL